MLGYVENDCSSRRKAFFFEKKKQKAFSAAVAVLSGTVYSREQKFFGSFFQKRTACLARVR